ncbi:hypothetical protein [Mycobacterium marinum]|uniref:hypothetical protein n=1 Tax=Mycobacterium marinum TaxID=1781 RepID=UPI00235A3082|nr:hypothetical protein [Mycobacterium marinum]MDC8970843.1 hypothetical protein [Mycobacterium marinum]
MTDLPHDYERRATAFRLLSAVAHVEQNRFAATLDGVMQDPHLRDVIGYLAGLAMERFREAHNGDWAAATADIDMNLRLAEDMLSLDRHEGPQDHD